MMGNWQPATDRRVLFASALAVTLATTAGGAALLAPGAAATASMTLDTLSVAGVNETVSGNVSDVRISTTLDYNHSVPDASRRIVKLRVGPSADNMTLLDYQQTRDPAGTASGSVTLAGTLLDHQGWTADTFDPGVANTTSREVVVEAVIEVHRSNGQVVSHTVMDTATVTLSDDAELTATIGGSGSITVSTTA
jgi:hypothetical protein